MRRYPGLFLFFIVVLAVLGGAFVYPTDFGTKNRPWRLGLDLVGGSHLVYNIDLSKVSSGDQESVINGIRDVIERRVNLFGVSEPQVFVAQSGGETHLVVELAGIRDIREAIKQIGETPLLDFREVESTGTSTPPNFIQTELTGRYITGAQLTFDPTTQQPEVSIAFNDEGAKIFEEITEANVGRPLAIFLDGIPIEAPTVQEKISGGRAVISGRFTLEEARQLVARFNAGALPAPITLISQQTVSASLGANSLGGAILSGIIGTLFVLIFMVAYYRTLGIIAAMALIVYIALTLAVFKIVSITMTLAGLAGFILTIGMAVDANILIFERIKEEIRSGLSKKASIERGFTRAWPSIRDSNVTTILTAIILYFLTSSFVKGFALTLLIGVIVSMFSAITTTRLFLQIFVKEKIVKA